MVESNATYKFNLNKFYGSKEKGKEDSQKGNQESCKEEDRFKEEARLVLHLRNSLELTLGRFSLYAKSSG